MRTEQPTRFVALACGGSGGHLFPGIAIAEALQQRSCDVTLLVSPKDVDQEGVRSAQGMEVETIPAIAFQNGALSPFLRGFWNSYWACRKLFRRRQPHAVLAMGGFTSAPPICAGRILGAATFLHESNSVPGRANRWLSCLADEVFVGFSAAARGLLTQAVQVTGTPVRPQFKAGDSAACRIALALEPTRPVLLVMGGSQGARSLNDLARRALAIVVARMPQIQLIHLTGRDDSAAMESAYRALGCRAVVRPFLTEMELALGAATLALSRAGASSLAELAALRVPSILIPYPFAADNHQFSNARAYVNTGAARQLDERQTTPETLAEAIVELAGNPDRLAALSRALEQWHFPQAADQIADCLLNRISERQADPVGANRDRPRGDRSAGAGVGSNHRIASKGALLKSEFAILSEGREFMLSQGRLSASELRLS